MPADPLHSATTLARLVNADRAFRDAQEQRRQAIIEAVRAEIPLRDVAEAAGCSHESVRRIVAADGVITIEFQRTTYPLTKDNIELLIYKLAGYAAGRFPQDVELLGAGNAWLRPAGKLAAALQSALADEDGAPVTVGGKEAFALQQVLRLTYLTIPSTLARLRDALNEALD
jgi:hypothetical protein